MVVSLFAAAQWLESVIIDIRPERVREVTITHADGEVVRISKASPELANFDVAGVPEGRELSYPGVANVVGNALRELNLEDVEPNGEGAGEPAAVVEYRTFDGLLVRVTGTERDDAPSPGCPAQRGRHDVDLHVVGDVRERRLPGAVGEHEARGPPRLVRDAHG